MGCSPGKNAGPDAKGGQPKDTGGGSGGEPAGAGTRLLEEYSVGATLGEGAFGVVSNCTKRATGEQFAVKMVDKVETPVEAIKKEAEMLQRMNHPNIVKFHGVFYERCFVCIVMDKYSGGDLVEGLQRHLKERGQINCQDVVHVAKQMGASIQHLHHKTVVHRDIKGDNYLMDRKDITHADCKIVLTDFGTAIQTKPNERLSAGVGTKIFWSPEFYDRDYGLKVDVWAMGVILYGLVSGRFPFKDQHDIKTKEVKIPKRVHPVCEDFIKKQLEKNEVHRLSADQVMDHQWIVGNGEKGTLHSTDSKDDIGGPQENFREDMVNDGIKERRQELINRLNREHNARDPAKGANQIGRKKSTHHLQKFFYLNDKMMPGAKFMYEWWSEQKAAKTGLLDLEKQASPAKDAPAEDTAIFRSRLEDHKVDTTKFGQGKAKTLDQLAAEVHSGACRLMLDATEHKKLVRVADIVVFRLLSPATTKGGPQRLLVETEEKFSSGQTRPTNRLPGTKKEPSENALQTAGRILQDMLDIKPEAVTFDLSTAFRYEEEIESPSYPGVRTVYRKEIVEASIKSTDSALLAKIGLSSGFTSWGFCDKTGNHKTFQWMTEEVAKSKKVKIKAEGAEVVSTLVRAPIGLNEDQLRTALTKAQIDVMKYGQSGKTKTLKEFAAELIRGEATFTEGADMKPMRVVDVVLLIIRNPQTNEILVQTLHEKESHKTTLNRLPGAKCRPDENQFLSARRIIRRQLEIDENDVNLIQDVLMVEEEKPTDFYPGLKTVYRKRLIKAELVVPTAAQV